jgi:hypothetical protein
MDERERQQFLLDLDDELLKGGCTLSEWCAFIVRDSDTAFEAGADLATIITAIAGVETYLRTEYPLGKRSNLFELIEKSPLADDLKRAIHALRRYRNRWVHVAEPEDDQELLNHPDQYARELEVSACQAVRTLRRVIYENQFV